VWFESIFGTFGELMTIVIMSPILLMFGEILPRTIFQQRATQAAPKIARPFWIISHIISPVTFLVFSVSKLFYRRVGSESIEKQNFATREELELILNIPGQGSDVKKKEKKLISRVFNLAESNVADVMVPLINVTAISHTSVVKNAITVIRKTGFSRLPVYKDRIDNIIGIVHTFDLIDIQDINAPIQGFIKQAPFVPEFKRADALLISMQKARNTIVVVVDEYGGAAGIITVEDILEEVVGEIRDEYDPREFNLKKLSDKEFLLNARMEIEHINEQLNINIPKEDYETLGGFLLKRMGKIPQKDEFYVFEKIRFTIKHSTKRSVLDVLVELP
jgi:CBS domain containing-hemolysin-like protein